MQRLKGVKRLGISGLTAAALMLGAQGAPRAAALDLSSKPLFLKSGVAPNLIITLDDSGSMGSAFMPDDRYGDSHERFYSAAYNGVAYNPNITYEPPLHADGTPFNTSFTSAWENGITQSGGTRDLSTDYVSRDLWGGPWQTWPAFYAMFDNTNSNCNGNISDDDCYDKVDVSATSGPGGSDERANFANWYSFYRTRNLATITGASRALYPLGNGVRVGWQRLNTSTTIEPVQPFVGAHRTDFYTWLFALPHSGGTPLRQALQRTGEYFKTAQPYYNNAQDSADGSASCRQDYHVLMSDGLWNGSLSNGPGNYDDSSQTLPDGTSYTTQAPYEDDTSDTLSDLAFKYWAEDLRGLADTLPPFMPQQGGSANANYWNAQNDPANWQHLVNFTVGLGLGTFLTDPAWGGSTFTGDYPQLAAGTKSWPTITSNTESTAYDLWHAAINSRGEFFSADNPKALADAFRAILSRIADRTSSGTSVAIESGAIAHSDNVYIARFNSRDWTGQVTAYALSHDPANLGDIGPAVWDAACALTGGSCATDGNTYTGRTALDRQIVTYNPTSGAGVPFQWANLDSSQTTFLNRASNGTVDGKGEARLNYLRGERSQEQANGGAFRNRKGLLGDVVDATPLYVGPPDRFYPSNWDDLLTNTDDTTAEDQASNDYNAFKSAHNSRAGVVYVGANDGMLHAFSATTGEEIFAYVPSAVYDHLSNLTAPSYSHRFYVDATPTEGDAFFGGAWHTILVGGLRAGGKGLYALDITDVPGASAGEASVAAKVLWELTDADLGYTYGKPQVLRLHNGHWAVVFGNGYNSSTGNAVLFIRDLENGTVTKIDTHQGTAEDPTGNDRPNGLASVTPADVDGDSIVDYLYAGDLFGNLWKFDVKASNPSNWKIAYGTDANPTPLFTAVDANGTSEPITTAPSIRRHPTGEGYLLMFGTGKYLENQDSVLSTEKQSVYGIWDRDASTLATFTRSHLREQTIEQATTASGTEYRILSDHPITWYTGTETTLPSTGSNEYLGWYMDLTAGEMQVTDSLVRGDRLIFTTLIPNNDPCSLGGDSWLMVLDFRDGGRFNPPVFDTDNNGIFNLADLLEVDVDGDGTNEQISVGGQKSKSGILQTPTLGSRPDADRAYLGGSDGKGTDCAGQDCTDIGRDPATRNRQSWLQLR